jgi:hypothetical protein
VTAAGTGVEGNNRAGDLLSLRKRKEKNDLDEVDGDLVFSAGLDRGEGTVRLSN